jgi:hypothetical protein
MERARLHAVGGWTGYVQPCGLIVSAGCDKYERHPADATGPFASFEGAAGTCCRVRPKRPTLIASAGSDRFVSRRPDGILPYFCNYHEKNPSSVNAAKKCSIKKIR